MSDEIVVEEEQKKEEKVSEKKLAFYEKLRAKFKKFTTDKVGKDAGKFAEYLLSLPDFFIMLCRLSVDKRVAKSQKLIIGGIIAYVISPIDIIPDFIPVFGYMDDLVLVVFGLNMILNELDKEIVQDNWSGDDDVLELMQKITHTAEQFLDKNVLRKIKKWLRRVNEKSTSSNEK